MDGARSVGPDAEAGENAVHLGFLADDHKSKSAIKTQPGNTPVATPVTDVFEPDLATDLRHAADLIRSGRVDRLTADWRARIAAACDQAAELVAPGTRRPREFTG